MIQAEKGSKTRQKYDEKELSYISERDMLHGHPYPYGFILDTTGEDGDNIDCFVITDKPVKSGSIISCEIAAVLEMHEGKEVDNKVIAVVPGESLPNLESLREILVDFITGIFKEFPGQHPEFGRLLPASEADILT